jgi:hypothetical protein
VADPIQVNGLRPLLRQLKDIDEALPDEVKAINKAAAEDVLGVARGLAPRDTGALLGSLKTGATRRSATVKAGGRRVPYATVIHFGWPRHGIRPQPFLYDALDRRRNEIVDDYQRRIDDLLGRVFTGGTGGE